MRNLYVFAVLLFLSGCIVRPAAQYETEYAQIPSTFDTIPTIQPIPLDEDISVEATVELCNALRTDACTLRSRYLELLRYSSQGTRVLSPPNEVECPTYKPYVVK